MVQFLLFFYTCSICARALNSHCFPCNGDGKLNPIVGVYKHHKDFLLRIGWPFPLPLLIGKGHQKHGHRTSQVPSKWRFSPFFSCMDTAYAREFTHSQKLTWNLEMMVSNRNLLFQGSIFRFHVCFGGCTHSQNSRKSGSFGNPPF